MKRDSTDGFVPVSFDVGAFAAAMVADGFGFWKSRCQSLSVLATAVAMR